MNKFLCAIGSAVIDKVNSRFCSKKLNDKVIFSSEKIKVWGENIEIFDDETITIFINGYIFESDLLQDDKNFSSLINAVKNNELDTYLSKANGYFTLLIVYKDSNRIIISTDRYGIKPVYLSQQNDGFLVGDSLSKLFGSKQFEFKLNKESINQYINIGYIMGDSTLFESVNRILPSRIISIDSNSLSKKEKLYWRWSENRRVKISYDEAVDLVHTKFQNSVDRSIQGKSKISLTLSGGLDSRALLAAVKNSKHKVDICCFTFGEENCEDIKIASDVATLAGVKHIKKQLINDNWLSLRKNGLRITDGMENIIHMHGLSVVEDIISHSEHVLNGYLGDLVFGGSWLHEGYLGSENLIEFANKKLGELADKKTLEDSYFEHSSTDPYFIFNRGVRFTSYGSDLTSDKLNIIKPFMDVDLIDLLYSLPDSWRLNGRIYQDMLIKYYPEYFENIPWQSTGKCISYRGEMKGRLNEKIRGRIVVLADKYKFLKKIKSKYNKLVSRGTYVDYSEWIKDKETKDRLNSILTNNDILFEACEKELIINIIDKVDNKKSVKIDTIGALLSISLFLEECYK